MHERIFPQNEGSNSYTSSEFILRLNGYSRIQIFWPPPPATQMAKKLTKIEGKLRCFENVLVLAEYYREHRN